MKWYLGKTKVFFAFVILALSVASFAATRKDDDNRCGAERIAASASKKIY